MSTAQQLTNVSLCVLEEDCWVGRKDVGEVAAGGDCAGSSMADRRDLRQYLILLRQHQHPTRFVSIRKRIGMRRSIAIAPTSIVN